MCSSEAAWRRDRNKNKRRSTGSKGRVWRYLNGVLHGSKRALCLSSAGPGVMLSSWRWVEMYLGGGPPKISSLFCSTCSQRCRVFSTAWHRGEATGKSVSGKKQYTETRRQQWWGKVGQRSSALKMLAWWVCIFIVYPTDHILPLGKRTWGWPRPAEPWPDASNTSLEGNGSLISFFEEKDTGNKNVSFVFSNTN